MKSKKYNKLVNITREADTDIENKLVVTVGGTIEGWGQGRYKILDVK